MYWGCIKVEKKEGQKVYEYKGTNNLGKILQAVRGDIVKQTDTEKWLLTQQLEEDPELYPEVSLIVIKDNQPIDKLLLENKNYFLFGAHPKVNFKLEHPSISKFHAAIYFS